MDYLTSLGLGQVQYEPHGNIPPDFLIDGRIAVEVRRLNQNIVTATGKLHGIEKVHYSIVPWFNKELPKLGPGRDGQSWYVSLKWRRPLSDFKQLREPILRALREFKITDSGQPTCFQIHPNFELSLNPAGRAYEAFFCLSSISDLDAGGPIVSEAVRNVQLCMSEKEAKIEQYRSLHPEWWLVLVDTMFFGLTSAYWSEVRNNLLLHRDRYKWSKVIILGDNLPSAFELYC